MHLSRRGFGLGVAGAAVASGARAAAAGGLDQALTAYLDAAFEQELALEPERLTRLGRKTANDRLTDRSEAGLAARLDWRRGSVAEMKRRFDPARLGEDARTSYDIWVLALARAEEAHRWRGHGYVFDRNGLHTALPNFMINTHRVDSAADQPARAANLSRSQVCKQASSERGAATVAPAEVGVGWQRPIGLGGAGGQAQAREHKHGK